MKAMNLLIYLLPFFSLSFSIKIEKETPIKFMLVITESSYDNMFIERSVINTLDDPIISSRFDYSLQKNKNIDYPYPVTEIFHGNDKLGTIYGIPNKDFLSKILPSLEDQVLALERIRQSN